MGQIHALLSAKINDVQNRLNAALSRVNLPSSGFSQVLSQVVSRTEKTNNAVAASETAKVQTNYDYAMPSTKATQSNSNLAAVAALMMNSAVLSSGNESSYGLGTSDSTGLASLLTGSSGLSSLLTGGSSLSGLLTSSSSLSSLTTANGLSGYAGVNALTGLQSEYLNSLGQLYGLTGTGQTTTAYEGYIQQAAAQYQLDPDLIKAVIRIESDYDPQSVSNKGAMGLMQLMPGTAEYLGVTNAYDPQQNIDGGAKYLRELMDRFGDVRLALGAYRSGPGYVGRILEESGSNDAAYMNLTDGTRNYVEVALGYLGEYKSTQG